MRQGCLFSMSKSLQQITKTHLTTTSCAYFKLQLHVGVQNKYYVEQPLFYLNPNSQKSGHITDPLLCPVGMISPKTKTLNICSPYFVNLPRAAIRGYSKKVIITSLSVSVQPSSLSLSVVLLLPFSSSYCASKPPHSGPMEQESPYCVNSTAVLPDCETDLNLRVNLRICAAR